MCAIAHPFLITQLVGRDGVQDLNARYKPEGLPKDFKATMLKYYDAVHNLGTTPHLTTTQYNTAIAHSLSLASLTHSLILHQLGQLLVRLLAESLALNAEDGAAMLNSMTTTDFLRLNHYPPSNDDSVLGVGEHTDYGCITILAQVGSLSLSLFFSLSLTLPLPLSISHSS